MNANAKSMLTVAAAVIFAVASAGASEPYRLRLVAVGLALLALAQLV